MSKLPAIQFYIGDWLKDPELSMCSPSTRGIWMDLICAMHELNRSGQITGTVTQLSRLCRCTAVEMSDAIAELKSTKTATVMERNGNVTLVNRRMQREAKLREDNNNRVRKHRGNAPVTELKRESNTPSSSSTSFSPSNTTTATEQERAREPAAVVDFEKAKQEQNGNGAKSKFDETVIREYVDFKIANGERIVKPGALAYTLYKNGSQDRDIQDWLDSGKKQQQQKRKAVIPG